MWVSVNDAKFRLDKLLFEKSKKQVGLVDGLCALIDGDSAFVLFNSRHLHTNWLYCIDRATGDLRWTADVWVGLPQDFSNGSRHVVHLVLKDGILYVFGQCYSCSYIEGFAAEDGKPIFRFSTAY